MKQTNTTTNYKREFQFLDSQRKLVKAEAEITNRNGYPEFTASGECSGSLGQVFDHVEPANEAQTQFIKLWKEYHLNGMNAGTDKQAEIVKDCKTYKQSILKLVLTDKDGKECSHPEEMKILFEKFENCNTDLSYFNLVAEYGGNELILAASNTPGKTVKDKAGIWFFKNTMLFDVHPETGKPYRYGSEWIKKELPEDFEETLDTCIDEIEEAEETRKGEPLTEMEDSKLIELIEEKTDFSGRDAELCAALVKMFNLSEDDLNDIEIDDNNVTVQGTDYLAGDDDEMNEELKENIKQSVWAFTPSFLSSFTDIDEDVFKVLSEKCEGGNDAILSLIEKTGDFDDFVSEAESGDGRGHFLNRYDGGEKEATINGTVYYAYKN